jgi:hypothetical protein
MTKDDTSHSDNAPTGAPSTAHSATSDHRAVANMMAADAYAASLKPILFELLMIPSQGKRMTPTGWQLSWIANELNKRGFQTRRGTLFRPTTVKRLLDRMPGVVEAAHVARHAQSDAVFEHYFGAHAHTGATNATASKSPTGISDQNHEL